MREILRVKSSEIKVTQSPNILVTYGLGSCVAVMLYDPLKKLGGLAHIMLPDSSISNKRKYPAKFADLAIDLMIEEMMILRASQRRIKAKLVGGASMFSSTMNNRMKSIGGRNILAVKKILNNKEIDIVAEDTGGNYGRSLEFFTENGLVVVRSVKKGKWEL